MGVPSVIVENEIRALAGVGSIERGGGYVRDPGMLTGMNGPDVEICGICEGLPNKTQSFRYPIFLTALRTGARQGEQIGLAWDAIDWNGGFVTIRQTVVNNKVQSTKNRQSRRIPLTPTTAEVLKARQTAMSRKALTAGKPMSPWVFPSPTGSLMDPAKLRKEFTAALVKAKVRSMEFRSLRNTALTIMAESGVPITALQRIAGHRSIEVAARFYLKVKPEAHKATLDALSAMDSVWNANEHANANGNGVMTDKP